VATGRYPDTMKLGCESNFPFNLEIGIELEKNCKIKVSPSE
jgi:hypothetical protein